MTPYNMIRAAPPSQFDSPSSTTITPIATSIDENDDEQPRRHYSTTNSCRDHAGYPPASGSPYNGGPPAARRSA